MNRKVIVVVTRIKTGFRLNRRLRKLSLIKHEGSRSISRDAGKQVKLKDFDPQLADKHETKQSALRKVEESNVGWTNCSFASTPTRDVHY